MLRRVFMLGGVLLIAAALTGRYIESAPDQLNWVLGPAPLVLVLLWLSIFWPGDQPRRFWFLLAVVVSAGLQVLTQVPVNGIDTYYLELATLLLFIGWAARGLSMDSWRWALVVPVIVSGLAGAQVLHAYAAVSLVMAVPVLTLQTVLVLCLLLSPGWHPVSILGGLMLGLAYFLANASGLLIPGVFNDLLSAGLLYLGVFLLALGVIWTETRDADARADIAQVAHLGPAAD